MRTAPGNPGDSDMTAVSSVSSCMHWIRGCIIILLLTILDQGSKSLVLAQLKDQPDISLIPGVLQLRYLENRGMAFGLFEGKIPVFVILCLLFFGVFIYVCQNPEKQILSAAVSNCTGNGFRCSWKFY